MNSSTCLRTLPLARRISATPGRSLSFLSRPKQQYEGHVPMNTIERAALGIRSAWGSLMDPRRGDLIAATGEATATPYFIYRLRDAMLKDATGRRILKERPRITSKTLPVDYLRTLPKNSLGAAYVAWMDSEGVGPDSRDPVRYIDDEECAYVMQRYRESHDFIHAITGLPIIIEGEIAVKAFEFANTLLPMTGLAVGAIVRLKPAERQRFWDTYLPWAVSNGLKAKEVITVYWEEQIERDVDELRAELGIEKPPDLRAIRKALREQHRAAKAAQEAARQ